jgi:putative lipoprotein
VSGRAPLTAAVAAALVLAAACASPAGPGRVTGTLAYRERIALPEGAVARVMLVDVAAIGVPERVIAVTEIRPAGQVPIAFAIDFAPEQIEPERRYGVRATLAGPDGRPLWATPAAAPVLTQGAPETVELWLQRVSAAAPPGTRVLAYDCAGFAFRVEVSRERARLLLPGRSVTLPAAPSASGAKYSDGSTTFWSKGDEASLRVDGVEHGGCRARARPVP